MPTSPTIDARGVRHRHVRTLLLCVASAVWLTAGAAFAREPAELMLATLRTAIDEARFEEAERQARALLLRPDLRASERNRALELLAVTQIAAREEAAAHATLAELYARDPEHPSLVGEQGPRIAAAHARARAAAMASPRVALTSTLSRDAYGRPLLSVHLGAGRDAVDTVHVFTRGEAEREATHLVAEVDTRTLITLPLPAPPDGGLALALYVEARAPSGAVIGREATHEAPLRGVLAPHAVACVSPSREPVRRAWWLWTSVALVVVAGMAVSGAVAAH